MLGPNASPLTDLVVVRMVMEPGVRLLRKQIWLGSAGYDRNLLVQALQRGTDAALGVRDFRLLKAA